MTSTIKLFCLVDGGTVARAFSVKVSLDDSIDDLKSLIKSQKTNDFSDIDADKLTLWKVSILVDPASSRKPVVLEEIESKEELLPTSDLSDVFEDKPLKNTIHILVGHPPLTQQSISAKDLDHIAEITVTINGVAPRTVDWITTQKTATLDHLRKVIYDEHPTLRNRSQTIVYEQDSTPLYLLTDSALQDCVRKCCRDGFNHLVLRFEDPPKSFSDITFDDMSRLYGDDVDHYLPFDETKIIPFTSDKHTKALDNLYITLESAIASMPPGDRDLSRSPYYTNAFLMHAVALFPELQMTPRQELTGRRAYGALDYAVESKADPSRMLAVTTFAPSQNGTGITRNIVEIDTIMSNRKRKRSDHNNNDYDADDTSPFISYGIATDSHNWYLQQCTINKLHDIGYNFPIIHSSKIPTTLNFAKDKDRWRQDTKKIFGHIVWLLQRMIDDLPPKSKRSKTDP